MPDNPAPTTEEIRFPPVVVARKTGSEPFHDSGTALGFDLLTFWQWAASDVTNNALRGTIAEYLVARALALGQDVRVEWDRYDLRLPCGLCVEVKSAAYCQSWGQTRLSKIEFAIAPTRAWNSTSNTFEDSSRRQANVYVFALLHHRDKLTLDPLNVEQWTFLILSTADLNAFAPAQKSISWNSLLRLKPLKSNYSTLCETITQVIARGT